MRSICPKSKEKCVESRIQARPHTLFRSAVRGNAHVAANCAGGSHADCRRIRSVKLRIRHVSFSVICGHSVNRIRYTPNSDSSRHHGHTTRSPQARWEPSKLPPPGRRRPTHKHTRSHTRTHRAMPLSPLATATPAAAAARRPARWAGPGIVLPGPLHGASRKSAKGSAAAIPDNKLKSY